VSDLLVNLLKLPPLGPAVEKLGKGILVRRANSFEQTAIRKFVEKNFSVGWADEISVAYARLPVTLFVATKSAKLLGFVAYECTRRGFLGPMGVVKKVREKGIGKALLLSAMWGMYELGYVYGIIGGVGPVEFYRKTVGAVEIEGSSPGIYGDILRAVPRTRGG